MEVEVKIKKTTGETEVVKFGAKDKCSDKKNERVTLDLSKMTGEEIAQLKDKLDDKQKAIY